MKKSFIIGIYCFSLFLILNSCLFSNCTVLSFNKKEASWYTDYFNLKDTVFYKGSDNSIDTFIITNKFREYSRCNKLEISEYQYEEFSIKGSMINKKVKNSSNNKFIINFTKNENNETNTYFELFDIYTYKTLDIKEFSDTTLYVNAFKKQLKTIQFDHADEIIEEHSSWVRIANFHWNKNYGLVQYTTRKGVVYDFWKIGRWK